ncbi:MAG: GNAT family N-acetyltransferase [Lachnospiraceae bacterium]|nr:GNAT family N-acetyltransferase [Lachnospiraceae bacterium]
MEYNIRTATRSDAEGIARVEAVCFPPAEAASLEQFQERLQVFPECYVVAEADGKIIGALSGAVTDEAYLPDEMYHDVTLHKPDGSYQTVFGMTVDPDYQHQGIASALMRAFIQMAKERGRKGIILTCKDKLIPFYTKFGYEFQGVSDSTHGNAKWNTMLLKLDK